MTKIAFIRAAYKLPSRYDRLRRRGMPTTREVAARLNVCPTTVQQWGRQGLIQRFYHDALNRGLWVLPPGLSILKGRGGKAVRSARVVPITAQTSERSAV